MKIAIIGAGPAGLYFSTCQEARPQPRDHDLRAEPARRHLWLGRGVLGHRPGLLREADPEFFGRFVAHHERCDYMEIVHQGTRVQVQGNHFAHVPHRHAGRAGAGLPRGRRADPPPAAHRGRGETGRRGRHGGRRRRQQQRGAQAVRRAFPPGLRTPPQQVRLVRHAPALPPRFADLPRGRTRHLHRPQLPVQQGPEHLPGRGGSDSWRRAGLDTASEDDSRRYCAEVFREDLGANELLGTARCGSRRTSCATNAGRTRTSC